MKEIKHFVPGQKEPGSTPLEHYLQFLPGNVVSEYVSAYSEPGGLVVDPFAQTGTLPLKSVTQGKRAIASNFNPINTLLVRGLLTLPSPQEMDAATTRLGDSLKRGVPLRERINQLYATTCSRCLLPLSAQYFVWDADEDRPVEKYCDCPHCAAEGQFPVEQEDLEALNQIEKQGVHYWYLLERLARPHEPERRLAQELLELYTPRNLYALTDLSMKIELLFSDSPLLIALQVMLLSCLDSCSKLDASSLPRPTARRLHPPSRFVERNVWHAFEEAYRQARRLSPASPLTPGLDLEEDFQALVINEPVHRLAAMLPPASVSLVVTAPPAYYRPFWTLSYLWSGWLWGREKAALFRPLLRRKMMGWSWYQRNLSKALSALHRPLRPQGKVIFILDTADLVHVSSLMLAALGADLKLDRSLYQSRHTLPPSHPLQGTEGEYRLCFSRDAKHDQESQEPSLDDLASALQRRALSAAQELLRERGEALSFSWLHNAIYQAWAQDGLLRQTLLLGKKLAVADFLQEQIEAALEEARATGALELLPRDAERQDPALWWLAGKGYPRRPLGERVEQAVRDTLDEQPEEAREPLTDRIYSLFPGLFTPGPGLVDECLNSHGRHDEASGRFSLHPEDRRESRRRERQEALDLLVSLGESLGYRVALTGERSPEQEESPHPPVSGEQRPWRPRLPGGMDVAWGEEDKVCHLFAFRQTTVLGDILSDQARRSTDGSRYIVTPDRRVQLLRFRIRAEFLLRRALSTEEWQLIKLSHLRALAGKERPDRQDLAQIVGLEPLIESPEAQLPLFP